MSSDQEQLSPLAETHELFTRSGIDYWLFGGWARKRTRTAGPATSETGPARADLPRAGDGGEVYIPLGAGRALWSDEPPKSYLATLSGLQVHVLGLAALKRGKSRSRDDPEDAAKDRADFAILSQLG
jgi:hypothetical protein